MAVPYPEFPGITSPLPTPKTTTGTISFKNDSGTLERYVWNWDAVAHQYAYQMISPTVTDGGEWPFTPSQFAAAKGDVLGQSSQSYSGHPGTPEMPAVKKAKPSPDVGSALGGPFSASQDQAIANATNGIWGWIKNLFSAQLWDRILFVFGGLLLIIVGLVFMLHKQLPSPL